jgi:Protein of unknown function (DUF3754)
MATNFAPPHSSNDSPKQSGARLDNGLAPTCRERSIPIRPGDLGRLLLAEPGLAPLDRSRFSQLIKMLSAVFHYEYLAWLVELKDLYAPLDPDTDCVEVGTASRTFTEDADEAFLQPFEATVARANYRALDIKILENAIAAPNEQGLNYVPDFTLFEHLRVYVRGESKVTRTVRNLRSRFRKKTIVLDGYRRLIVALKFRPGVDLGDYVRSDVLYLRMFKDVPHVDMEMHLPEQGTKVRMRLVDKAQIASPFAVSVPTLIAKLAFASVISLTTPIGIGAFIVAPISAGVNSFFGFQRAKQKHMHRMIRHLYYLALANNESVINRLIDAAEEEELKEALLAYFFLWRGSEDPEPWTEERLDDHIESYLRAKTSHDIDFEIGDALAKLLRLGLVQRDGRGFLFAAPPERALEMLDEQWDNYFNYSRGQAPVSPTDEADLD